MKIKLTINSFFAISTVIISGVPIIGILYRYISRVDDRWIVYLYLKYDYFESIFILLALLLPFYLGVKTLTNGDQLFKNEEREIKKENKIIEAKIKQKELQEKLDSMK